MARYQKKKPIAIALLPSKGASTCGSASSMNSPISDITQSTNSYHQSTLENNFL